MKDSIIKIVKYMHNYMNLPITPSNTVITKPKYPYITYDMLATSDEGNTFGNIEYREDGENMQEVKILEPEGMISFTSHSKTMFEALEVAQTAWNYLNHIGYDDLALENVVIVKTHNITDRTILDVDAYEYRYGFDVRVRYSNIIERKDKTIDKWGVSYD